MKLLCRNKYCDVLTFKETYKPVSLQTKLDFMAWLQGQRLSEVFASEATHRSVMVSRILSQYCGVSKEEAEPSALLSPGKLLTHRASPVFSLKRQNILLPSPSFFFTDTGEKKTFQASLKSQG